MDEFTLTLASLVVVFFTTASILANIEWKRLQSGSLIMMLIVYMIDCSSMVLAFAGDNYRLTASLAVTSLLTYVLIFYTVKDTSNRPIVKSLPICPRELEELATMLEPLLKAETAELR